MSPSILRSLTLVTVGACLLPGLAHAGAVAVTPLVARGLDAERTGDLYDLMSFELENVEGVDEVVSIDRLPSTLTSSCLTSTRCLGSITRGANADAMLTGYVERKGSDLLIDLVYYDATSNRILRRKAYSVPNDPVIILEEMTPMVAAAVTGVDPRKQEAAERMDGVAFEESDEDLDFYAAGEGTGLSDEPASGGAMGGYVNTTERPITAPSGGDAGSAADITFGEAQPEIAIDFDLSGEVSYGDNSGSEEADYGSYGGSSSGYGTSYGSDPYADVDPMDDPYDDDIEAPLNRGSVSVRADDEPVNEVGRSSVRSSTTTAGAADPSKSGLPRFTLTAKGGYSYYTPFNFGTIGAEGGIRAVGGLYFVVGVDLYIVRRQLPPELIAQGRAPIESNFIVPVNAGFLYRFDAGRVKPYLGADFIFSQYYLDPTTNANKFTFGARGRAGVDIMITSNFGLNADLALGGWSGNDWQSVDPRAPNSGFLPHASAGFVLGF